MKQFVNKSDFEIILVDNNSDDKTINEIAEDFSNTSNFSFRFIKTVKNIGFGNACNLAAESANGTYLCFLNPDTEIKSDVFSFILDKYKDPDLTKGIAGFNVAETGFVDYSAGYFPNLFFEALNIFSLGRVFEAFLVKVKSRLNKKDMINLDWVMGAAFFINRDLFIELNGFDSDYFLYFEEMDLCKRAKNSGAVVKYFPSVKVDHIGSAGSKKNYYFFTKMFYKGKLLFLNKHSKRHFLYIYQIFMFLHILTQILLWKILSFNNKSKSQGKISAFREVLSHLSSPQNLSNNPVQI
ncbi:MAG: glycosyltransferase [Ignavibacterium sp.]|nr:glycosyltransferase [Ignavibacterium sp.]